MAQSVAKQTSIATEIVTITVFLEITCRIQLSFTLNRLLLRNDFQALKIVLARFNLAGNNSYSMAFVAN